VVAGSGLAPLAFSAPVCMGPVAVQGRALGGGSAYPSGHICQSLPGAYGSAVPSGSLAWYLTSIREASRVLSLGCKLPYL
jgi:hypothetical protein